MDDTLELANLRVSSLALRRQELELDHAATKNAVHAANAEEGRVANIQIRTAELYVKACRDRDNLIRSSLLQGVAGSSG